MSSTEESTGAGAAPLASEASPNPGQSTSLRRAAIRDLLVKASGPVAGEALAARFGVSRQAIVGDVAVLRAAGVPIVATVRGYLVPSTQPGSPRVIVAVRHRPAETEAELMSLVDLGVRVLDVIVEHPIYGEVRGSLALHSPADVRAWLAETRERGAHLLSELTEGVHLHTLEADDPARLDAARATLAAQGFLLDAGDRAP